MNQARRINHTADTNPISVLRSIGARQGVIESEPNAQNASSVPEPILAAMHDGEQQVSFQLYRGDSPSQDEAHLDAMQNTLESALQIQQLAVRLRTNEDALVQREKEFESKIDKWNESVQQQQADLEARLGHMEQNASQVRCQQLHLMQLQTDIVKSYDATKTIIESLVSKPGSDVMTISSLEKLKHEISGRFDYISRRWSHLANLMQQGRDEDTADRGVNDSVDWTV